jgi:hypothetical protein
LTLDNPGPAPEYWLEVDVISYTHPPSLARQRLDIIMGGATVHSFDPVPRGVATCTILATSSSATGPI